MPCNPSVGGTAKGCLVREGGEMGKAADATLTHLRMLNLSKGPAVQSLRAQIDKYRYHDYMKALLENTPNLYLRQGEAKKILTDGKKVTDVETVAGISYKAKTVVVAAGVYLESSVIIGSVCEQRGPSGFSRANYLADSLRELGFTLRRFKTGTPARVKRDSVDLTQLEIQEGEDTPYSFTVGVSGSQRTATPTDIRFSVGVDLQIDPLLNKKGAVCYLGYTNPDTHAIIQKNLKKSPKYAGLISGAGARWAKKRRRCTCRGSRRACPRIFSWNCTARLRVLRTSKLCATRMR
jgi:tRNA uridine 5-carboxymethylaminomethyl modification enzyme